MKSASENTVKNSKVPLKLGKKCLKNQICLKIRKIIQIQKIGKRYKKLNPKKGKKIQKRRKNSNPKKGKNYKMDVGTLEMVYVIFYSPTCTKD